jgi:mRNA interferase MazF
VRRGDVFLVNLDPVVGSEASKTRPAVIVSNDASNAIAERLARGTVTVAPITSNTTRVYPFQVSVPAPMGGLSRDSKIQCEQVRTIDTGRLVARLGHLDLDRMPAVDQALRIHLAL